MGMKEESGNIISGNTITNCRIESTNFHGIYISDSSKNIISCCNIRTICDICRKNEATDYVFRENPNFDKILQKTKYKKSDYSKIHILGL